MVITFENVSFKYIEKKLLDDVSFSITDSDKIGVVGVNGTGKTTLLKLICGEEKPIQGQIIKSGGMILNVLPQDPRFEKGTKIIDNVLKYSTKEHPILEYEAKSILSKLGLNEYDNVVDHLSGGQKKRLALAICLVTYSDILILDEPTNHLDNDLIVWLEKFLIKWKRGLIMVTHDRYFLQRVCNKMMELDYGKVYLYEANYDKFLEFKAERLKEEAKSMQKLKSILKKEREWMNRSVEARRTKSKSRIERFEKLSKIEFNEHTEMNFSSKSSYLGKKLIEMKNGYKSFPNKVLFEDLSFSLNRNDIIGIVGENGAGKTTLFKIIMGEESLDTGELIIGETLKIGYFSQSLELIDPEIRVIDYIEEEQRIIDTLDGKITSYELLEQFLFDKELQYSKVKMLSGGEKRRLQLVRILMKNPNVLILDEPTNDLDIYTIEILENYLDSFKGPILLISHDRYFLDKLANKLFVFEGTHIKEYNEAFSEYLEINNVQLKENTFKNKPIKNKMPTNLRNEYNRLNEEIPKLELEIDSMKKAVNNETTDFHKIMELQEKIEIMEKELDNAINRLFELEEIKLNYM